MPCSFPPPNPSPQNNNNNDERQFQSPAHPLPTSQDDTIHIDLGEQIWLGLDAETRTALLYLTKQSWLMNGAAGGLLPGYAMDELQLVRFISICQDMLRELRLLPLEPRIYP